MEYETFLVDRFQTVQALRASGGDARALDSERCCVRGLENFQNPVLNDLINAKRKFHHSTILIEQIRQSMFGLYDPERFRLVVGAQSEFALRRAQQLAALDQKEVHGVVHKRMSSCLESTCESSTTPSLQSRKSILVFNAVPNSNPLPVMSEQILSAQQLNARRLIEIYSRPGHNPFRLSVGR